MQTKTNKDTKVNITGITLLSLEEYKKYQDEIIPSKEFYKDEYPNSYGWWWLRSPGDRQLYAADVYYDGSVHLNGCYVYYDFYGVRPALKIKILDNKNILNKEK